MPEAPDKNDPATANVFIDIASVDIFRDRERGVPRYCAFRRHLGMFVPKTFEELTDDPQWQAELREVYGDVERVDLLVGTLAESKSSRNGTPPGFGFSDTAFRIFILHGIAPAEERPLLHRGFPAGRLYPGGLRLGA